MKIKTCVFPAAGYGTRFLPATKAMPKEMLPILTKPLIQYGVEEAVEADIYNIAFITGRGKRALEDHFDISYELEHQIEGTSKENHLEEIRNIMDKCTISYTRQKDMNGLGHAILCAEHFIKADAFAVILADDLCHNDGAGVMKQMVQLYEKHQCSIIATMEVSKEAVENYGVVSGKKVDSDLIEVSGMVEKPSPEEAPSRDAVIGRYILSYEIFEELRNTKPGKNEEIQLTDAINALAKKKRVLAYQFKGQRFDCGSVDGFVEATSELYKESKSK